MGIVAKYKFNQNTYADFIPTFNSEFTDYTITDEIGTDGFTIRTIESDDLPTLMQFGTTSAQTKSYSLLSVLKCNTDNIISMSEMFNNSRNLTSINLSSFNTQNVTNMGAMFKNCTSLTSLDLSNFNTNQVTSMGSMFYGCSNLTSLDLSSFNTEKITNTYGMFYGCSNLTSLDLSSFNTEKITSMNSMFYDCKNLTELDLKSFNTEKVTKSTSMFANWTSSQKVYISSKWTLGTNFPPTFIIAFAHTIAKYKFNQNTYADFLPTFNTEFTDYTYNDEVDTDGFTIRTLGNDSGNLPTIMQFGANSYTSREESLLNVYECDTSEVTNMSYMFDNCSLLTSLDVSNFNTSNVTNMSSMFQNCSKLTSLDVSNFDTSQATRMSYMFQNCSSLTSLDVSNFNTENVTTMDSMFNNCSKLTSLEVSNFNTEKVTSMGFMFQNCSSLTSLDVSHFNTSRVTDMYAMFNSCSSLTSLDISNFDTSSVTNMRSMFQNCPSLISLDVSNFNTSQVTSMYGVFNGCSSLTSLDVSNFNTENVTTMDSMFNNCSKLTSLEVSNFNTEKVTSMGFMFRNCSSLTSLDVSNFDTNQVTSMNQIFYNCSSLTLLDVSNFNIKNVVADTDWMFRDCFKLTDIGVIYCNPLTINKISDLITTDTTIWYSDAKLEDLTKKENITYKEYKMNILESDEEIVLRRIGDACDELNLSTGELTQRISEITFDGSDDEIWTINNTLSNNYETSFFVYQINNIKQSRSYITKICDKLPVLGDNNHLEDIEGVTQVIDNQICIRISKTSLNDDSADGLKAYLQSNPITVQYELEIPVIKTINLKGKPSINWQGDTYLHLENNTLYPQLDCEVESINYYEIPKLKANTLYTLRYVGEPTQCIFGGLTYETENNMILTSGSSDNLLYFDKEVRKVILIEGDVRDRNFDYFEGIESLGAVEIITHKTNMPIFAKGGRK